jgi:hypothetical protein
VIASPNPDSFNYAESRFGHWVTDTSGAQRLNRSKPSPPVPASRGATFLVDLLDFTWPDNVLHRRACEIRIIHFFAPRLPEYDQIDVCSPVFSLDGTVVQSLLNQLPDEEK